ncbi:hypothetical protein [Methylobacterium sp. OT2]|uniref:TRAFAC clade GTPase domain-containing protein n=1 Tax=Methylobacterium sp. OT2 TaxID=2813779 RepID=UPI00197C8A16|nr:hypothetical protein [Methylobacterium sp. OT2]MBN4097047.1 hypothetical protein [Methylobacterium sp. OT2]
MVDHRHVVIGFQGSGKTTYAAALWYLVDARAKQVTTVLSKGAHRGEYAYLEMIADAWERGYQVKRTGVGTWKSVTINLRAETVEGDIELSFIDMSGETFEQIFVSREYDARLEAMVSGCEGMLLFVSADRQVDDASLVDFGMTFPEEMPEECEQDDDDEAGRAGAETSDSGAEEVKASGAVDVSGNEAPQSQGRAGATPAGKPSEFRPALTPRQVQIVDLLEAFSDAPLKLRPKRIAVVISAWDLVGPDVTPDGWLMDKMPLVDQYLRSRSDEFETRIYGVSAQGGRLPQQGQSDEGSDRQALLAMQVPSSRIRVVGHGAEDHDLTHPIAWLSSLEE